MRQRLTLHEARLVAGLALLVGFVEAQETSAFAPHLEVTLTGDIVTMTARNVAVQDVLAEISRQNGLILVAHEPVEERLTLEIRSLPLVDALRSILRNQSYTFQQAHRAPGRLWVFSNGTEPAERDAAENPGDADTDEVTMSLSRALADDPDVRREAVSSLGIEGGNQAAAVIAVAAVYDEDASVREEAVYALGETGGVAARQTLEQAILDSDDRVREAAVEALAEIGGEESALALAAVLNDEDSSLRQDAVYALAEIGGETAIGILQQAVADHHIGVREAATDVLAELYREKEP